MKHLFLSLAIATALCSCKKSSSLSGSTPGVTIANGQVEASMQIKLCKITTSINQNIDDSSVTGQLYWTGTAPSSPLHFIIEVSVPVPNGHYLYSSDDLVIDGTSDLQYFSIGSIKQTGKIDGVQILVN